MTEFIGTALVATWIWSGGTLSLSGDFRQLSYQPSIDLLRDNAKYDEFMTYQAGKTGGAVDYRGRMNVGSLVPWQQALEEGNIGTLSISPQGTTTITNTVNQIIPAICMGMEVTPAYNRQVNVSSRWIQNGLRNETINQTFVYYVANNGDDNNDGLSTATPWKSIAKVNSFTFQPGDMICFRAGDTWRETLDPTSDGTAVQHIIFTRYGAGDDPIIDCSDVITFGLINGTINHYQVGASLDDAYDVGGGGGYLFNNTAWNYLNYTSLPISSGHRFQVNVNQGTTIGFATLRPHVFSTDGDFDTVFYGDDVDNSANFATVPPISRTLTSASKTFSVRGNTGWIPIDVTNIVQEIINRTSWVANNYLSIISQAGGPKTVTGIVDSYDGDPSLAAKLSIGIGVLTAGIFDGDLDIEPNQLWLDDVPKTKVASRAACVADGDWFWSAGTLSIYAASDPNGRVSVSQRNYAVDFSQVNYVTLDHITVQRSNNPNYEGAIRGNGAALGKSIGITISSCTSKENAGCGINLVNTSYSQILNNVVSDNLLIGIFVSMTSGATPGSNLISGNNVNHNLSYGIDVLGVDATHRQNNCEVIGNNSSYNLAGIYVENLDHSLIHGNTCEYNSGGVEEYGIAVASCSFCDFYDNSIGFNHNAGLFLYSDQSTGYGEGINNRIFRNIIHDHTVGADNPKDIAFSCVGNSGRNNEFFNNILYGGYINFWIDPNTGTSVNSGCKFYYNTCFGDATTIMRVKIEHDDPGFDISNNIFSKINGYSLVATPVNSGLILDHNCYHRGSPGTALVNLNGTNYNAMTITSIDSGALTSDPLFVSTATPDFHLQAGSPCKASGLNGLGVLTDYDGVTRAPIPSRGAYE